MALVRPRFSHVLLLSAARETLFWVFSLSFQIQKDFNLWHVVPKMSRVNSKGCLQFYLETKQGINSFHNESTHSTHD